MKKFGNSCEKNRSFVVSGEEVSEVIEMEVCVWQ